MSCDGVRGSGEAGAVAVEFALVFPVLVLILFGVIEFGRVWSQTQVFQGAAREGARCAAVKAAGYATCDIRQKVVDGAAPYTPAFVDGPSALSVRINGAPAAAGCTDATRGKDVTVSWEQPFTISIPFWDVATITTTVSGVFRCE